MDVFFTEKKTNTPNTHLGGYFANIYLGPEISDHVIWSDVSRRTIDVSHSIL